MTSAGDTVEHERSSRGFVALLALALVALIAVAYSPSFGAHFVNWDDHVNLGDLRERHGVPWSFFVRPGHVDPYQPLAWVSLALDYRAWGLDPGLDAPQAGLFHATSVLIHALTAVAFLFVARRVLALARPGARARSLDVAAALAATLFAVHPLRCESVAWITERRDEVSGLFYALAAGAWLLTDPSRDDRVVDRRFLLVAVGSAIVAVALAFTSLDFTSKQLSLRGLGALGLLGAVAALVVATASAARATSLGASRRRSAWLAIAVASFALALTAKGLAMVLPAVLLVLDAWPLQRLRRASIAAALVEKIPLLALALVSARVSMWAQAATGKTLYAWNQHGLGERCLQALYGLWFYPSRTLVPLPTSPAEFLPDAMRWSDPRFLVPALVVAALAVALLALRRRAPALLAAFAAFAIAVAPVLGLTQAGPQLVADRYSYLSCLPLALLGAGAWLAAHERPRARLPAIAVALAAVGGLTATTFARTRVWHDSESLWSYAIRVDPSNGFAHTQLAFADVLRANAATDAAEEKRLRLQADALYRHAIEIDPTPLPGSLVQHGYNLIALGRAEEALPFLAAHVASFPDDAYALAQLGSALAAAGRLADARTYLERAVAIDRDYPKAWQWLARARDELGDKPGAIEAYERLVELWPRDRAARERLAQLRGGG